LEYVARNLEYVARNLEYVARNLEYVARNLKYVARNLEYVARNLEYVARNLEYVARDIFHIPHPFHISAADFILFILNSTRAWILPARLQQCAPRIIQFRRRGRIILGGVLGKSRQYFQKAGMPQRACSYTLII
jgi:hypothetical protein